MTNDYWMTHMNSDMIRLNIDDDEPPMLDIGGDDDGSVLQTPLRRMLIVDDEEMLVQMLAKLFRNVYDVRTATSGAEGLVILREGFVPELIIADQRMPGMSGAEFLGASRAIVPMATRIVLTGYTDVNDIIASINQGHVYRFITKPWNTEDLKEAVRLGLEHYDLITRNTELNSALRQLAEMNQEQKDIMNIIAHDLKNPISSVRMIAEALFTTVSEEQRKEFYGLIINSSEHALTLIADLLHIESLERGGYDMMIASVNLEPILANVVHQYTITANAKSIKLEWEHQDALNALVEEKAFLQIMDNLLSNAVKYSFHHSTIRVVSQSLERFTEAALARSGIDPASVKDWIGIAISDAGPGFTEEDKNRIFEKFAKLSAQPTGGESSTGLGLSIVKRYVDAINGKIWLQSEVGQGSTFYIAFLKSV